MLTRKMETVKKLPPLPPIDDTNAWVDLIYYTLGLNPIPVVSKAKVAKKGFEWKQWQTNSIPEDLVNTWKQNNDYAEGIAVITGLVWRGNHKGKYFTCIDCDNLKAIEEFCTRNGVTVSIKEIAEKFIVEQHRDNLNKCHIYFYSDIPILAKSSDVNKLKGLGLRRDEVPLYEIKSKSNTLAFCTPSLHQNGEHYEIFGNTYPELVSLNATQARELMHHIDSIVTKHGLKYLANDNGNGKSQIPIHELFKQDCVIYKGNDRHLNSYELWVRCSDIIIEFSLWSR